MGLRYVRYESDFRGGFYSKNYDTIREHRTYSEFYDIEGTPYAVCSNLLGIQHLNLTNNWSQP